VVILWSQLIREQNKVKQLQWATENLGASFEDVICTDETIVQLDTHRRFCCRKKGQKPRYKPRPKHPTKVHVWASISWRGATNVCIFEGIMNADLYINILDNFLVHSYKLCIQRAINLCKTTTLNTLHAIVENSLKKRVSTGG